MSDAKTPKAKPAKEAKTPAKSETAAAKKTSDSGDKSADTKPSKASEPKSAAQSSISHFSSVATDDYRAGWANIFGKQKAVAKSRKKKPTKKSKADDLPLKFVLFDEDISDELRADLYKAFQKKCRKEGVSLAQYKKSANTDYRLECRVTKK